MSTLDLVNLANQLAHTLYKLLRSKNAKILNSRPGQIKFPYMKPNVS